MSIHINLEAVMSKEDRDSVNRLLTRAISTAYDTSVKVEFDPCLEKSGRTYTLTIIEEESEEN